MKDAIKKHGKWIAEAVQHPGALRKELKVPEGKNIPAKKLEIKKSDTPLMRKRKTLAKTLKGFNK
jgi:hypothetical protein